jgi:SAM-dependent methyltransferase
MDHVTERAAVLDEEAAVVFDGVRTFGANARGCASIDVRLAPPDRLRQAPGPRCAPREHLGRTILQFRPDAVVIPSGEPTGSCRAAGERKFAIDAAPAGRFPRRVSRIDPRELVELSRRTLAHYENNAEAFWQGTRDHDVSQNIDALLAALGPAPKRRILDFGCGPGRDLLEFRRRGHEAVGLEGCAAFVQMARELSGAPVYHQDFLALDLPESHFDGVFANASLFHVPSQELPRVLAQLWSCLAPSGILFCSNPRGENREGYSGERYAAYHDERRWCDFVGAAGFELISRYYRPSGLPREQQPWLATLWRKVRRGSEPTTQSSAPAQL